MHSEQGFLYVKNLEPVRPNLIPDMDRDALLEKARNRFRKGVRMYSDIAVAGETRIPRCPSMQEQEQGMDLDDMD